MTPSLSHTQHQLDVPRENAAKSICTTFLRAWAIQGIDGQIVGRFYCRALVRKMGCLLGSTRRACMRGCCLVHAAGRDDWRCDQLHGHSIRGLW